MKIVTHGILLIGLTLCAQAQAPLAVAEGLAAATPDGTFDAMKGAAGKKDWAGFASCLTSESQDLMIGGFGMLSMLPGPAAEKMKGLNEAMTKHGAKPIALQDMIATQGDQKKLLEVMGKAGADVKNKPTCIGDAMNWIDQNLDKATAAKASSKADELLGSTLSDVTISGDAATGKLKGKDDKSTQIDFKKVDGKWYMDMAAKLKLPK